METAFTQNLLSTKFSHPRQRPTTVQRPRLIEKLEQGRWQKVTLICGPAGSGKSTLLSEWINRAEVPFAWLSLEAADNDPKRFLTYLIAALNQTLPRLGEGAKYLLRSPVEVDLIAFLENLVIAPLTQHPSEFIFVMDDLHAIDNQTIYDLLRFLIKHMPSGMHLALASRSEPPLALATLRVKGQLNEVMTDDLRFRQEEAKEFYNHVMGLGLTAEDIASIERYTEGWIAACQLAALRLQKSAGVDRLLASMAKDGRLVSDYLVEEVLQHQSQKIQEFMAATSVLQRMTDSLCAALVDEAEPAITLEMLEKQNLFIIPLDDNRIWYRYHHLFAELLRDRVAQQSPELIPRLHRRASQWFADQELTYEAVDHAIQSGDQPWLITLIERWFLTLLQRGEVDTLQHWLNSVDRCYFDQYPVIAWADAGCAVTCSNDLEAIKSKAERAERILTTYSDRIPVDWKNYARNSTYALRAFAALRNREYTAAIELAERAHSVTPNDLGEITSILDLIIGMSYFMSGVLDKSAFYLDKARRIDLVGGNYIVAFSATAYYAAIMQMKLRIREAAQICIEAIDLAEQQCGGLLPAIGTIHIELGISYFLQAKFRSALTELEKGIRRHRLIKANPDLTMGYCILAHTKLLLGDEEGAAQTMHEASIFSQNYGIPDVYQLFETHQALLDLQSGNFEEARRWADEQTTNDDLNWIVRLEVELVRAIVMIGRGAPKGALEIIDRECRLAQKNEAPCYVASCELLKAIALDRLGQRKAASMALQKAALMSIPGEDKVCFLIGSAFFRPLLQGVEDREAYAFLAPLIANTSEESRPSTPASVAYLSKPIEPLSERELEVLVLISQGWTNQEIAKRLCVSLSTVKTFVRRIYAKLEVKNRTKAVHVAKHLGLLKDN